MLDQESQLSCSELDMIIKAVHSHKVKDAGVEGYTQDKVKKLFIKLCVLKGTVLSLGLPQSVQIVSNISSVFKGEGE